MQHINLRIVRSAALAVGLAACALLSGCGGGGAQGITNGGGGGNGGGNSGRGQDEATTGVRGLIVFEQSGGASSYGRGEDEGTKLAGFARRMSSGQLAAGRGWSYDSDFGLYYQVTNQTDNYIRVEFATDQSGRNRAGYLDLRLVDGLPYPVTIDETFDIRAGNVPIAGSIRFVIDDSEWRSYRTIGAYGSSRVGTTLAYDLRYTPTSISGSMRATDGRNSVSYTNLVVTADRLRTDFVCNGIQGHMELSSNGSGFVAWRGNDGNYRLDWDSSGNATITYPNGQRENVGSIYG